VDASLFHLPEPRRMVPVTESNQKPAPLEQETGFEFKLSSVT
jgi:hypothetical protein